MGHERIGQLPKSQRWRDIVGGVASSYSDRTMVDSVATDTLRAVRQQFRSAQSDESVVEAFSFLVRAAVATRSGQLSQIANRPINSEVTPLSLAIALRQHLAGASGDPENAIIAKDAAIDAIGKWYSEDRERSTGSLFDDEKKSANWEKLGTGAGFCELSRHFFASFAERYLNFFLDREVASALPTIAARDVFRKELHGHVDDVSEHAFETAKITQSFAAAWFNKHASSGLPDKNTISSFVSYCMSKLRDELNREEDR